MNGMGNFLRVLFIMLVTILLIGCGQDRAIPTATQESSPPPIEESKIATETEIASTDTEVPPTETMEPPTETPIPPTETPEITTISAAEDSIEIGVFSFRIVEVAYDDTAFGLVPSSMSAGDQIVWVAFELQSGDQGDFESLEITLTDQAGQQVEPVALASGGMMKMLASLTMTGESGKYIPEDANISWAFAFPKNVAELYLEFPGGEIVDLTPIMP